MTIIHSKILDYLPCRFKILIRTQNIYLLTNFQFFFAAYFRTKILLNIDRKYLHEGDS